MTKIMRAELLFFLPLLLLTACSNDTSPTPDANVTPSPNARHGTALPFNINHAVINSAFQNDTKLAQITISVNGGSQGDWVATGIRAAERAVSAGGDAAQVNVNRADLDGRDDVPNMFRELATVYYAPNKDKDPWSGGKGGKVWGILIADHLVTSEQINIYNDFENLTEKLVNHGMDPNRADEIAGKKIARKYHLKPDWRLPIGGTGGQELGREDFVIDQDQSKNSQDKLVSCLANNECNR